MAQEPEGPASGQGRSTASVVLHALGGAIVGGWIGWMGSQVSYSDWNEEVDGEFAGQRRGWVIGGMVTGAVVSQLVGPTSAPGVRPELTPYRGRDRNVITRAEIQSSGATNAYEVVESLRSEWLRERGVNRWAESGRGEAAGLSNPRIEIEPGEPTIIAYLNQSRLGGVEELYDIPIDDLQNIEFVPPRTAAVRYGSGHAHGVIQLSTQPTAVVQRDDAGVENRIIEVAASLFLERGYDGTSLAGVANRADLSRQRVNSYFANKAALFDAVVPAELPRLLETRLREWIQSGERTGEDDFIALLRLQRVPVTLILSRADGSPYESVAERLAESMTEAALDRFQGTDTEPTDDVIRESVREANRQYLPALAERLEASPDPAELEAAVRAHNRYHLAVVGVLLDG